MRVLILLLLISCGKNDHDQIVYENDVFFDELKEEFYTEIEAFVDSSYYKKIKSFPISFEKLDNANGICSKNRYIKIDEKFRESEYLRRLVFHELGHCILNLGHIFDNEDDLMYSTMNSPFYNYHYLYRIR